MPPPWLENCWLIGNALWSRDLLPSVRCCCHPPPWCWCSVALQPLVLSACFKAAVMLVSLSIAACLCQPVTPVCHPADRLCIRWWVSRLARPAHLLIQWQIIIHWLSCWNSRDDEQTLIFFSPPHNSDTATIYPCLMLKPVSSAFHISANDHATTKSTDRLLQSLRSPFALFSAVFMTLPPNLPSLTHSAAREKTALPSLHSHPRTATIIGWHGASLSAINTLALGPLSPLHHCRSPHLSLQTWCYTNYSQQY